MESLIFNQKKYQSIVIKTMAAIAAGVGAMLCISSSVAAMMMGGEEKEDPVVPKTPVAPTEYVYEFIINVPHSATIGHHINDFMIDDVKPPAGSVVLYQSADRGESPAPDSYLWDGDPLTQVAYNDQQQKDELFMTVTLNKRPKKFTFGYGRPLYAPGWIIKENGVAIITETENRGASRTPSPQRYDYVLP